MQRDYILRITEQVGQFLRRVIQQREDHAPQQALQSVMAGCERLFGLEAVQIFQFTPEQHVAMLADGEPPDVARDKILMYAALNAEAAQCYVTLGQPGPAQSSFLNALRLTLRAGQDYPADGWPAFAPKVADLLRHLGDAPLDPDTIALLAASRAQNNSP